MKVNRLIVFFIFTYLIIFVSATSCKKRNPEQKPNIITILTDGLGYGDFNSYNPKSQIPTPAADWMANEGVLFSDAYTPSAVSTPTRYGLLCGRYAWRSRLKRGVFSGYAPMLIDPDRQTNASLLKQNGYRTAVIGKWHLGVDWQWVNGIPVGMKESNL